MASSATSEATEIKRRGRQRLIGAIALVALLVVFVPMFLDKEPRPSGTGPNLQIPPKDNAPPMAPPAKAAAEVSKGSTADAPAVQASTPPVIPPPAEKQAQVDKQAPAEKPAASEKPAPAPEKAAPAAPRETPPKPAPAPAATVTPATPPAKAESAPVASQTAPKGAFAVQVGAFRDETKLRQARDKLAAAKVPHYTERLDAKGGNLTRLRAGPFDTREQAEAALATLKRNALDGKVVPLP